MYAMPQAMFRSTGAADVKWPSLHLAQGQIWLSTLPIRKNRLEGQLSSTVCYFLQAVDENRAIAMFVHAAARRAAIAH